MIYPLPCFRQARSRWSIFRHHGVQRVLRQVAFDHGARRQVAPARLQLWVLFVRFIVPQKHTEAKQGRRWFLLIAARLVESGRQKEMQVSIRAAGPTSCARATRASPSGFVQLRRS